MGNSEVDGWSWSKKKIDSTIEKDDGWVESKDIKIERHKWRFEGWNQ